MLDGYYFDLMEGTLPAGVRYEYVEFSDLPEGFVDRGGTVQQMGGIR